MSRIRLPAKLTRPRLHGAVERVRLFDSLDAARETRRAICVVGPPGAGKTTLVASWLDARAIAGIWFQVDAGDADLPTFFHYLGQAAGPHARRGQAPLPALTAEYLADVEGFSRRFFRSLFERLPEGSALVLDNYQEVEPGSALHRLVADAVEELPQGVVLVVISRRDPPETYARLMANEDVALVDWEDLRLTAEESRAFVAARLPGSVAEAEALHERCGGWAAGLTLMLEDRRRRDPLGALPEGREAIFAYFAAQIFARVPEAVRRFLVATAFLPQIPVSIARELTGEPRAAEILADLCERHLFTHRRAGVEPVYWYHALFRDFLRAKALSVLGSEQQPALFSRAARLLEAAGSMDDAFELFRDARDWSSVARLVQRHAQELLACGRAGTLQTWIGSLPRAMLDEAPWIRYWLGTSLTATDPGAARRHLEVAYDGFVRISDHTGEALAAAGIIDVHVYEWSDFRPIRRWVDALGSKIGHLNFSGSPAVEQHVTCSLLLGMLYVAPGHPELPTCVARVTEMLDEVLDESSKLNAAMVLLAYANLAADEPRARVAAARGEALCAHPLVNPLARMWWHMRFALHLAISGRYQESLGCLDTAESIVSECGLNRTFTVMCLVPNYRSIAAMALGDVSAVRQCSQRIIDACVTSQPMTRFQANYARSFIAWANDDDASVAAMGEESVEAARSTGMVYLEIINRTHELLALAATSQGPRVVTRLAELRDLVAGTCFENCSIEIDIIDAYSRLDHGDREGALHLLGGALRRWRLRGHRHPSLFCTSRVLGRALDTAIREGIEVDQAARVIRSLRVNAPADADECWPWPLAVRTLGGFEIRVDGEPLRFTGKVPRKPLQLLKAIIAMGPEAVPVARVVDALWPDEPGDTGRKTFDVTVTRLRRLLGRPELVKVGDEAVGLDTKSCWIDATSLLDALDEAPAAGLAPVRWAAACALYRGSFLPGDEAEQWTASRRELLRARFIDAVERVAAAMEHDRRWADALSWYRRGIEADELAESFHQGVMRCLLAMDRQAEAASAYRRLRQLLSVVLGIQPSARSIELARRAGIASVGDR